MSVYNLSNRISFVEYSIDELGRKADSFNAVLAGTTTINCPAFLNGPVAFSGTVNGITKSMVGLGNVDNTSDASKPISILTQTALEAKADKTTTYTNSDVDQQISNLIASAPDALNTLNELAQALAKIQVMLPLLSIK
jgi:hypothetical protein